MPDASGPFGAGPHATQVGITLFARFGLLPHGGVQGNFGIDYMGGPAARFAVSDPAAAMIGMNQGTVARGLTVDIDSRTLFDSAGQPLAGYFAPFRGAFSPQVGPLFLGSNADELNGVIESPAVGPPAIAGAWATRLVNFGSEGSGPLGIAAALDSDPMNLVGDLVPIYRMYYIPSAQIGTPRMVTLNITGLRARYIASLSFGVSPPIYNLPDRSITFQVPSPAIGPIALLALGLLSTRRRRSLGTTCRR